jgi:hypothetical protein
MEGLRVRRAAIRTLLDETVSPRNCTPCLELAALVPTLPISRLFRPEASWDSELFSTQCFVLPDAPLSIPTTENARGGARQRRHAHKDKGEGDNNCYDCQHTPQQKHIYMGGLPTLGLTVRLTTSELNQPSRSNIPHGTICLNGSTNP